MPGVTLEPAASSASSASPRRTPPQASPNPASRPPRHNRSFMATATFNRCHTPPELAHVPVRVLHARSGGARPPSPVPSIAMAADLCFPASFDNVSECEDLLYYARSSTSQIRSSSNRDYRQDGHYSGHHYYHCYASCLDSIAMSR